MITRNYNGKIYRKLDIGQDTLIGDLYDKHYTWKNATLRMYSCNDHRKIKPGDQYWREVPASLWFQREVPAETPNTENTLSTQEDTQEVLIAVAPKPEPDFSSLFTPAFTKFLDGVIDKRVDALLLERLDKYVVPEIEHQLSNLLEEAVEEAVGDWIGSMCLEDHFDINNAVSDAVSDIDFGDYLDVGDAVEVWCDHNLDVEEKVREALRGTLQNLTKYI